MFKTIKISAKSKFAALYTKRENIGTFHRYSNIFERFLNLIFSKYGTIVRLRHSYCNFRKFYSIMNDYRQKYF